MSCAGESEWSQIEELYGTKASDWEGVPVPEVAEGDQIEPCSEDVDTSDNSPATGAPTISGTVQVGETLTANTSGIADADGLANATFSYQWITDDSVIVASAARTYTPSDGDRGKSVKVRVASRRRGQPGDPYQRKYGDGGGAGQLPGHGPAHHQRDGPGRRDPDGGHVGHRRRGRA